ncbi:carbohydrate porin [Methylobacterium sp. C25]|nr:carbohydrate porin [Methylobacterium sp. C25]
MARRRLPERLRHVAAAVAMAGALWGGGPVQAQQSQLPLTGAGGDPQTAVAQSRTSDQVSVTNGGSIQSSLGPYGDPFGYRAYLAERGITYVVTYIGEGLADVRGGLRRGATYGGRLDTSLDVDLDKLAGWSGARFHTDFFQINGHGLSRKFVDNLTTVSGIEALSATRLFELWIEQRLFDDKLSLKVGQISADTEFAIAQSAVVFLNAGFGWPNIGAVVLPSGGPIYPLATPAIRAKYVPDEHLSFQAGLFNGDPAGVPAAGDVTDPQRRNPSGTSFRVNDPALAIAEVAYAYSIANDAKGLPGTATLGGWHHFGQFDSPRFDSVGGRLLADPQASGFARRFRGDDGIYAILDQTIYREPDHDDQGASVFFRVSATPSDRNLVSFYLDTGIAYKGLFPDRPNDTIGLGLLYSRIGSAARGYDRDLVFLGQGTGPIRSSEAVLELTYQAEIVPGLTVQPDFQYVMRPGGGLVDDQGNRIRNAAVFGLRTTINY